MVAGPVTWIVALTALIGVLAALVLLARAARRFGFAQGGPARPGARRLSVQETLPLDTRRRLVLLRCDGREALLVTGGPGGDTFLGWLP